MKESIKICLSVIALIAFGVFAQSCSETEGSETEEVSKEILVSVEISRITSREYIDYIPLIGTIKAVQRTTLSTAEGAEIEKIVKDKGQFAVEGDTVIVLKNDLLKAALDAAAAQYKLDQVTFEKQGQIYKDNVNSEFQYLQSKYRRDQSLANYNMAKARYDRTFLIAPFNCIVDRRYYDVGEFVLPGSPVVDLVNNKNYKVEVGVPEKYSGQISIGDNAKIILKSVTADEIFGKVVYVGTSITPDNRTFPVEISISSDSKYIRPELAAEVFIENGIYNDVFIIPDEVVTRIDEGYIIFVEDSGIAKSRLIEVLNRSGENIAVRKGLNNNDNLIVVGYQNLIDGQKISVVN
ncbi:MAG: efflux RND transporter periplasmic adaptor subunit [Melioribacteraceae bacterium]|nr:efflux RND transporter periplasmic adaptor subunit [Melioribacteraceae bacterium]